MLKDYPFKTKPFDHQREAWEATRERETYAVFWEQGTGKSKLVIDTAAWLYLNGKIDALLVVAPNGVQRNWITDEVPIHLPDAVLRNTISHFYETRRAKTQWHARACQELLAHGGFAVLAMAYSACMTDIGGKLLKKFLTKKRCLYVLDESVAVKTPRAKRTRRILGSARYAPFRRILTGTPITNGAFDVYAPLRFLDKDFWLNNGLGTFLIYKNYFGVFRDGYNGATGKSFRQLLAYKNLDELHDMLAPICTRVTKDEVLDLPPKLYSKRYVEMTREQERLYAALRDSYMIELEDGAEINAPLAIVRLLRLQQIICGYVPDDDGKMITIGGPNPRLDTLIRLCEECPHKAIIWARFRRDIDLITASLGNTCVRYDGQVGPNERADAIEQFQRGEAKFFVANPAAAGEGLTLHAARTVVYYNNSFKLSERLQSEDRAHRIGQEHPVHYVDLVAPGTVDERIVESLRGKRDVAQVITGDTLKEWL